MRKNRARKKVLYDEDVLVGFSLGIGGRAGVVVDDVGRPAVVDFHGNDLAAVHRSLLKDLSGALAPHETEHLHASHWQPPTPGLLPELVGAGVAQISGKGT